MQARRKRVGWWGLVGLVVVLGALGAFWWMGQRDRNTWNSAAAITGGNPEIGNRAITYHGCSACHTIPGVEGANGLVGPPLKQFAQRVYIAGVLNNTSENLFTWVQNPPGVDKETAMPNLRIPKAQLPHIAAYLYTLR